MACIYTYNGKEYTEQEMQELIKGDTFKGVVGAKLPPYETDGKVDVAKTTFKYLEEAVRGKRGIRRNAVKNYYYVNQKSTGSNSYTQAMIEIKRINRIFDLPVLGKPVKIQTSLGIKYRIPILEENIIKIQGAFDTVNNEYEYDDLIIGGKKILRFGALAETFKKQKSELYKKLTREYQAKKEAKLSGSKTVVAKIDKKIAQINNQINDIDARLNSLSKISDLESVLPFAEQHLKEIEAIFAAGPLDMDSIAYVQRIMKFWQKAGDFNLADGEEHILFNSLELGSDQLKYGYTNAAGVWVNGFAYYKQRMDHFSGLLKEYQEEEVTNFVQKYTNTPLNTVDIYKAITDANEFAAQTLSLGETKDPMLQSLAIAIKTQNTKARRDASEINEKVDELVKKIHPKLSAINKKDIYGIFKQKDNAGKETGDMVMRYSVEYFDEKDTLVKIAESSGKTKHWEKYFRWRRNNEIMFDVRKLFPAVKKSGTYHYKNEIFSLAEINAHKDELRKALGDKGYNKLMDRLQKKIEEFELDYELAMDRIDADPTLSASDKAHMKDLWDKVNSPYYAAAKIVDNRLISDSTGKKVITKGHHRTYSIPKRFDAAGNKTKWYDKNFEIIENDDDLFEFYDFMLETLHQLNSMLPNDVRKNIRLNTIPSVKKVLMEKFGSDHYGKTAAIGIWDNMMELLRSEDLSDITTIDTDPVDSKEEKNLKFHLLSNHKKEVEHRLTVEIAKYRVEHGKEPSIKIQKDMEKNILHEMAQNKSFDLGKILKLYAFTAYSFHHKAAIEDYVKLIEQQFYTRKESYTNSSGLPLLNLIGKPATKEGLDNYKAMLDFALRRFYNLKEQDVEGKTKQRIYTKEEKDRANEIKNLLEKNEEAYATGKIGKTLFDKTKQELEKEQEQLGGVLTGSGVVNGFIRWMQLKALGWNVLAGIANMGFGLVSNIVEAGDGRLFNSKHYNKAMIMVMHSVLRNFSFNSYNHPTAMKIRNLMDKLDVLKDASDEMYKATTRSLLGINKLRFLDPYQMQKRTEYINQAPVMIAIMLNENNYITDLAGNKRPIWDAFDDNGNWNTAEFGKEIEEEVINLKIKVDQAIKKIHGNYDPDSPLLVKKKAIGRLLAQFRTWMFEGFFNRFGVEYHDYSLGFKRKGRYRSGIATISYANGTGLQWWEQSLLMSKELCRRILLGHIINKVEKTGTFRGKAYKFEEVDYANLSANINEFLLYITATIVLAGLKHLSDDDDKKNNFAFNVLMNELLRVQTDIAFYSNPSAMETLINRPIPAMSLISDGGELIQAMGKAMAGNDELKSGVYAGDSRLLREAAQFFPGTTQAHKLYSTGVQFFGK